MLLIKLAHDKVHKELYMKAFWEGVEMLVQGSLHEINRILMFHYDEFHESDCLMLRH